MDLYAADRLKKLEEVCGERGLPLTTQRRTVLEVLLGRTDHPTADQIFEAVQEQSPPKGQPHGLDVCDFSVQLMGMCPECRKEQAK